LSTTGLLEEKRTKPKPSPARSRPQRPAKLVVLSADGMPPDFYRRPDDLGLNVPTLRSLVDSGASADAVESVYPTTTYPAHATLVTGVPPSVHGIYSHLASLDPTEAARPWCWFARALRVPALWDVVRATGRKSAAVSWPVSAGGAIDYNLPEVWDPALPDPQRDFSALAQHATPDLFEEVTRVLAALAPHKPNHASKHTRKPPAIPHVSPDRLRGEAALFLWRRYKPDLLLVHFVHYDQLAHRLGPRSPEALAAIEEMDAEIGRIRGAIAGPEPVTLVVVSDHGFVPVEKEAAPLVVFMEEGLFKRDREGKPQLNRLGAVHAGGSFAAYWLEEPSADDRCRLRRALRRLQESRAVAEILDRRRLEDLEADPDAEVMLDAAPGFYFSDRFDGPLVRDTVKDHGTHGQLPTRAGMEASFLAVGQRITPGKNLGQFSLRRVAPTLAHLLGLPRDILASKDKPLDLS
jgi:predicted AlkP superfamily pyrophosphatase or phosphodiesterase